MNRVHKLLVALATVVSFSAHAAVSPSDVVAGMTAQVLTQIANGQAGDRARVKQLVAATVMPNVDFRSMTASAVGPKWTTATEDQRARLMAGFEALLVKTYAGALNEAQGATVKLRRSTNLDNETALVRSDVIVRNSAEPISLNYRLSLREDQWKITDVSVMGVWLVASYRSQFSQAMESAGGLDSLIRTLEEKSR